MKIIERTTLVLFILAMILASIVPAYAIGFDTEEVYNSVFVIYSGNSLGSGFAIGENCIITNAHVISDKNDIKIATYNGDIQNAFIVSMDTVIDIAVIGVPGAAFDPLKIAALDGVNIGDDVYAIGAPNSLAFTLTKGVVSSKERYVGRQRFIQTDAAINSGNSGGPLLNDAGEVVGVNAYKMSDSEGIGLAIPVDVIVSYLETGEVELNENGNVTQPVTEDSIPEPSTDSYGYTEDNPDEQPSAAVIPLAICLILSVALNVVLIVILVFKKKKDRYAHIPPSERTDFDIEILD